MPPKMKSSLLDSLPTPAAVIDPMLVGYPVLAANALLIQAMGKDPIGLSFEEIVDVEDLVVLTQAKVLAAMGDWDRNITSMSTGALHRLFADMPLEQVLAASVDELSAHLPGCRLGLVMQYESNGPLHCISTRLPSGLRDQLLARCQQHWPSNDPDLSTIENVTSCEMGAPFGLPMVWGRSACDATGRRVSFLVLYSSSHQLPAGVDTRVIELFTRLAVMLNDINKFQVRFKKTQADLAERMSGEMTRRFLRATGHDLRQPLQALESGLELLRENAGEQSADLIQMLSGAVVRTQEILDSLIDLVRIEEGDLTPRTESFPLAPLLQESVRPHAGIAAGKALALTVDETDLWVNADPLMTQRMVECLVSNAVRYTAAGQVTVKAHADDQVVRITVADTGDGIDSTEVISLFDSKTTRKPLSPYQAGGIGLGLTLVKNLAELLGAEVTVSSRRRRGTTFTITLPRGEPLAQGERPAPAFSLRRSVRVLFVDDDPQVREVIQRMLTQRGFLVDAFGDPYQALQALNRIDPDLLLTDYRMPQMSGLALVAEVRSRLGRELPSLIMTGDTSVAVRERNRHNQSHFVRKPVRSAELAALIREVVAGHERPDPLSGLEPV